MMRGLKLLHAKSGETEEQANRRKFRLEVDCPAQYLNRILVPTQIQIDQSQVRQCVDTARGEHQRFFIRLPGAFQIAFPLQLDAPVEMYSRRVGLLRGRR